MPNLRVISDNVAAKASLTASTTAGSLVAANLLNDTKVSVHRFTGTSGTYTLQWGSDQTVGAVALPATNLTAGATIQVQLFGTSSGTEIIASFDVVVGSSSVVVGGSSVIQGVHADAAQIADSGLAYASQSAHLGISGWGAINANAFAHGGATKAAVWFATQYTGVRKVVITLSDPSNPAGYIDCSRVVVGPYWQAPYNPNYGASAGTTDLTKTQRTDSGDVVVSRGAQYQTMSLQLEMLTEADRAALARVIRSAGSHTCLFYSLLPGNASASAEQDHMIYGRRASAPFTFDFFNSFSTKFEIEGW